MSNKRGQSLILFILFLPVMLMSFALIVDVGVMYNAKIKGESILKEAVDENLDIKDYFKINGVNVTKLEEKNNCVVINTEVDSVFGNIIGFKTYDIKVDNC